VKQIQTENVTEKCPHVCQVAVVFSSTLLLQTLTKSFSLVTVFEGQLTSQHDTQHILLNSMVLDKDPKELKNMVVVVRWLCLSSYLMTLLPQLFSWHPSMKIWRLVTLLGIRLPAIQSHIP